MKEVMTTVITVNNNDANAYDAQENANAICGLSLLLVFPCSGRFSSGYSGFPLSGKKKKKNYNLQFLDASAYDNGNADNNSYDNEGDNDNGNNSQ